MLAAAPIGLSICCGPPRQIAPRTYSGLKPSGPEPGMGLAAGVVLGGQRRRIQPRRIVKKQTGIPLRAGWAAQSAGVNGPERAMWGVTQPELQAKQAPWAAARPRQTAQRQPWAAQRAADAALRPLWPAERAALMLHLPARRGLPLGRVALGLGPVVGAGPHTAAARQPSRVQTPARSAWTIAQATDTPRRLPWAQYPAHGLQAPSRGPWVIGRRADSPRRARWDVFSMRAAAPARDAWVAAQTADAPERFPFGARRALQGGWGVVIEPGIPTPGPGDTIVIPIQRAYIMLHDISVLRLPDNLAIPASQVTLGLDADAVAWSFSATLLGKLALDAVQPDSSGAPVTLEIALDGYVFRMQVEDWSEDRQFGQRGVSVKGRGLSAKLAMPYQLAASGATGTDMTIQQVLNAHLPIGSGWTIAWAAGTPDWLVPAGAWSWADQSPLAAIHAACSGVGLVVVPDPALQTLTIQPRYPVLPWAFAGAAPQITVPDAAILDLGRRNAPPGQANAAFVAGGNVGGVLARVYRLGTAGDKALATVQHPLITHTDAARLLGGRLLAGQAQQPAVRNLTIPFGGAFGLGLGQIGSLLEAQVGGIPTRGIVNSVKINAQRTDRALTIRQTLSLGEDTPNVWAGFARLLPQDPLRLATVQATFADATASVQYPDGGTQRVRNPLGSAAGASVYVRGGKIDSQAPSLAASDITV